MGLAQIYRKYALQGEAGREAVKRISWIKNKLLHIYYQKSMEDRWGSAAPGCELVHWAFQLFSLGIRRCCLVVLQPWPSQNPFSAH